MRIDLFSRCRAPLFLLVAVLLSHGIARTQPSAVREADEKCERCHSEIYRTYINTPMANASGIASEKLIPGSFTHDSTGLDYRISRVNGQAVLAIKNRLDKNEGVTRQLKYFLGSGHLGITYIYSINDFVFESPVAWYAASSGYDMKPGLAELKQAPPSLPLSSSCMRCHMSAVQASDTGTLNRYQGPPFLHSGITCEACHGEAAGHAVAGDKKRVVNPAQLTSDLRDSICISCHLEGDVTVERAGNSMLNFRPGESISTYLAFYVYGAANPTSRGVSEVEQFAHSRCKLASGDKMSCTSCHDPHFTPDVRQRISFYRSKCLSCHNQPRFATEHHPANQDCTSCHMARTGAENIPHVAWTDHRILRVPEATGALGTEVRKVDLAPVFSPGATDRDLAMANYKLMLDGNPSLEQKTWDLLHQLKDAITSDKDALNALGVMSAERGDKSEAEHAFRRVLELDPHDLTALSNLGILLAKQGDLNQAISLLQRAFDRNQDISGLAMNLARVECMAGNSSEARKPLETSLIYNPGLESLERLLVEITNCSVSGTQR
jgi:hypothetical protein